MPDYFDSLVARAAGRPSERPRARPRLPELFEPVDPFQVQDLEVDARPFGPAWPAAVAQVDDSRTRPAPRPVASPERPPDRLPAPEVPSAPAVVPPRESPAVPLVVQQFTQQLVPTARPQPGPAEPSPAGPTVIPLRTHRPASPPVTIVRPTERLLVRFRDEPKRTGRPFARTEGAQASGNEQVVRVSIGRLEVNTAAPAGPAAPAPDRRATPRRPEVAVSLADFLGREGTGGRR